MRVKKFTICDKLSMHLIVIFHIQFPMNIVIVFPFASLLFHRYVMIFEDVFTNRIHRNYFFLSIVYTLTGVDIYLFIYIYILIHFCGVISKDDKAPLDLNKAFILLQIHFEIIVNYYLTFNVKSNIMNMSL